MKKMTLARVLKNEQKKKKRHERNMMGKMCKMRNGKKNNTKWLGRKIKKKMVTETKFLKMVTEKL